MEELKKIISTFVKKDSNDIYEGTVINNTTIPGSIMVHRMYAIINKAGFSIKNYADINTYGQLLSRLNGTNNSTATTEKRSYFSDVQFSSPAYTDDRQVNNSYPAIGIDIEHIDNLPKVADFREDEFYTSNFSNKEISYALLKQETYETLAGLFCAKEALCKAENSIKATPFNQIEIDHSNQGAPVFRDFSLSISHANGFSIAVAVRNPVMQKVQEVFTPVTVEQPLVERNENPRTAYSRKTNYLVLALFISVAISMILLFIIIKKIFYPNFPHYIFHRTKSIVTGKDRVSLHLILGFVHLFFL